MSTVVVLEPACGIAPQASAVSTPIRIALLGLGQIGSAVAELSHRGQTVRVTGALVRTPGRARGSHLPRDIAVTANADALFADDPDVVVEALGGIEPARTLVRDALLRGIPVVTANKSLIARHGGELLDLAAQRGVPLLYEASVLAGVPFLGTFARRPHAAAITAITGIVNGTTNYILSSMRTERVDGATALAEAQRRGFAEPDPRNDVGGIDAAEKLAVLAGHFGFGRVLPSSIETTGITEIVGLDLEHAGEFGGTVKAIVHAHRIAGSVRAFAGPAFVPSTNRLSHIDGVENAVILCGTYGDLCFSGPGAGPAATAATILDDVIAAARGEGWRSTDARHPTIPDVPVEAATTGWFVRITGSSLPEGEEIADLLGSHGVWLRRASAPDTRQGIESRYFLSYPCAKPRIDRALASLSAATDGSTALALRTLES
jgi:homoserine dehydrogenase